MSHRPSRRSPRTPSGAVLALLAAAGLWASGPSSSAVAADVADLCARFSSAVPSGGAADPTLIEISGIAASRAHPGVLWMNNDSGSAPVLHAVADDGLASGADLGTYAVDGATAVDWEDIAVGPGSAPGTSAIYVADIGDNAGARTDLRIYRVAEPAAAPDGSGGTLTDVETLAIAYPGGPADAETLLVDPVSGDMVIVTKTLLGDSHVLTIPAAAWTGSGGDPVVAEDRGVVRITADLAAPGLPGTLVTGGDVAPDGSFVVLRTYQAVLAFERPQGVTVAEALLGPSCTAPSSAEPQGEAIAITADGTSYLTASEVQRAVENGELPVGALPAISRVAVAPAAAPDVSTTTPPVVTEAPAETEAPTETEAPAETEASTPAPASIASAPDTTLDRPTTAGSNDEPVGTATDPTTTTDADADADGSDRSAGLLAIGVAMAAAVGALGVTSAARRRRD